MNQNSERDVASHSKQGVPNAPKILSLPIEIISNYSKPTTQIPTLLFSIQLHQTRIINLTTPGTTNTKTWKTKPHHLHRNEIADVCYGSTTRHRNPQLIRRSESSPRNGGRGGDQLGLGSQILHYTSPDLRKTEAEALLAST